MATEKVNIQFGADTSQLRAGVDRAKQTLNGLKSAAISIGGAIAGALAIGGFRSLLSEFDRIGKLANRFDLTAESVQRLGFVAEQNGADLESMATALQRATKAGEDAAGGSKMTADAFKDLNIDLKKFNDASPEEKLAMMAEGFQSAETEGKGMAAVLAILGRSGGELIPTLRMSGDEIRTLGESISVASQESVDAVQRMNDAMNALAKNFKAPIVDAMATVINKMNEFVIIFEMQVGKMAASLGFFKDAASAITSGKGWAGVQDAAKLWGGEIDKLVMDTGSRIEDLNAAKESAKKRNEGKPGTTKFDPWSVFGMDDEYGPASQAGIEQFKRLAAARRYYQFKTSKDAISMGIDATDEKMKGTSQFSPVVASSLASIGGGGGVFGGSRNPAYDALLKQKQVLENQLTFLQKIEENTGEPINMRP